MYQNANTLPTPSDLAFLEFRKLFPNVNCRVAHDGSFMNYSLPNLSAAHRNMIRAQGVIKQQKLPLSVQVFSDYQTHILHIRYSKNIY